MLKKLLLLTFILHNILSVSPATAQTNIDVVRLKWSNDGSKIAGAAESNLFIWDASTGELLDEINRFEGSITSIAWNASGDRLAAASPEANKIIIWDVEQSRLVTELQTDDTLFGKAAYLTWNSTQQLLASATWIEEGRGTLRIWNTQDDLFALVSSSMQLQPFDMNWSPDGQRLAIADTTSIYVFDDFTSNALQPRSITPFSPITIWSSDGTKLMTIRPQNTIQIISADNGEVLTSLPSTEDNGALKVSWSPDETRLAIQRDTGVVEIWDLNTLQVVDSFQFEQELARWSLEWSPYSGRLALAGIPPQIQELPDGKHVQDFANGAFQMIVPAPSVDRLNNIAVQCLADNELSSTRAVDVLAPESVAALQVADLPEFVAQVKALPEGAIPAACAADLIAVAEAVIAQP